MPEIIKSRAAKEKVSWVLIGTALKGLAALLMNIGKKDPWMGRAIREFDGIYRFQNTDGKYFHYLVFHGGKVKVPRNWIGPADFTFTLHELPMYYLNSKPEHLLKMVFANKMGQTGNIYYLSQFGFVMSLVERYYREKKLKKKARARAG